MANRIQYGPPTYHDRIKAFLILAAFLAIFLVSAALALWALYVLWTLGKALLFLLLGGTTR